MRHTSHPKREKVLRSISGDEEFNTEVGTVFKSSNKALRIT
jgi:hypothetical protein